jgi:hypothetical protein
MTHSTSIVVNMQYRSLMTKTNRLLVIFNTLLATILVLVLVQFAPSVANADATTIVACANKKTGALRIAYKKCTKKENNVTWGVTGPQGHVGATGAQGATGPQGTAGQDRSGYAIVKDANNSRIQNVVDLNWINGGPIVLKDGLLWGFYKTTGEPFAIRQSFMSYVDSLCDTGFVFSTGPNIDITLTEQDTVVFSDNLGVMDSVFYTIDDPQSPAGLNQVYVIEEDGDCVPLGMSLSHWYYVSPIAPPVSLPAPLTLEFQ